MKKNIATLGTVVVSAALLAACNDSSSSSGSGSGADNGSGSDSGSVSVASFDDSAPSPRGKRTEEYNLNAGNTAELAEMLTGAFSGELPGGSSADGFMPLTTARTTTSPSPSQYYVDELIRQIEVLMASHERHVARNLQARDDDFEDFGDGFDFEDGFEVACTTGGVVGEVTDNTATINLGCEIDEGEGGIMRFTGNIAVEVSENLENIDPDACLSDEITVDIGFNDVWFRTIVDGNQEDSVYFDADMKFSLQQTDCDNDSFESSFSGDRIVLMVDTPTESDFIGMFDYDYSVEVDGVNDIITANMQATLDTDELDGVLDYDVNDMAFHEDADYPHAGTFALSAGGDTLTFTFISDVPDDDPAVQFELTGNDNCSWEGSWNDLNAGDVSCD